MYIAHLVLFLKSGPFPLKTRFLTVLMSNIMSSASVCTKTYPSYFYKAHRDIYETDMRLALITQTRALSSVKCSSMADAVSYSSSTSPSEWQCGKVSTELSQ